jgi:serine protease Do
MSRSRPLLLGLLLLPLPLSAQESPTDRRRTPIVAVFEKCRDAVVNISTTRTIRTRSLMPGNPFDEFFDFGPQRSRDRRVESVGSGVVVHESGYIVTNAHVVAQASDVQVTFANKQTLPARVIAVDPEHDLAVLKVESPQPLAAQRLGRSDDIMVGETVVAIGNPLGLQHTVTAGIVSARDRDLQLNDETTYHGLIQTDAPINPGNSGGPLLNVNGELIGINTAIRGDAQNIGFAIPVDRIWELLPSMLDIERRQRVRFGLSVSGTDARVVDVRKDSPAAKAGLAAGDRLLRFNDHALRDGIDYYVQLLDQQPDSEVRLVADRAGQRLSVKIPLEAIPIPDGRALARKYLGLTLSEVTPDIRRKYDLPDYAGLVAESVEAHSPADRARILPGDLILRLDRVPVTEIKDVGLALEQLEGGAAVRVEGLRLAANPPFGWRVTIVARKAPESSGKK